MFVSFFLSCCTDGVFWCESVGNALFVSLPVQRQNMDTHQKYHNSPAVIEIETMRCTINIGLNSSTRIRGCGGGGGGGVENKPL